MLTVQKLQKAEVPALYEIALRAFQQDYERYGVYPPLLDTKKQRFMPPRPFGRSIYLDGTLIGGAFVLAIGKKGELGAIFLEPAYRGKEYGREAMRAIEAAHPGVRRWKLETPAESTGLHRFYESLGYQKTGEIQDEKSGMVGFVYEKETPG